MADLRDQLQRALGDAYTIERELGGGGMSRVYLAEETALHRKVVVKILPPEMAGQVSIDRFQREIGLAATLQHAHIVPLLTAGDAGGLPYFTMPYVRGESLRSRISKQGELPVSEAMRILREVASALAFAHEAGVVHRDIKPDNVLMAGGAAMVTDFGVAKAVSESTTGGGSGLTSLGVALGTPAYMAPEQASADPLTDHRADIYSWGVLAYELLTGGTPFAGRPAQAMLSAHVTEAPEPVTKRRAQVPPGLASLVMRCLEKRAADRPQIGAELVRALDEMVTPSDGLEPTTARPATSARRATFGTKGLVLAVSVVIVAAAAWYGVRRLGSGAAAPRSIAVLPFENKSGDSTYDYLAEGMSDELRSKLTKLPGLTVMARSSSLEAVKGQRGDTRAIGARLGVGSLLQASVSRAAGRLHFTAELVKTSDGSAMWSETFDGDVKDFSAIQDSISHSIVGALSLRPGGAPARPRRAENPEARDLYLRGRHLALNSSTEEGLHRAASFFEQALAKDPAMAEAHAGIGFVWAELADAYLSPAEAYPKTKVAALKAIELDSTLADSYVSLAGALAFHDWDFSGAERALRHAIALNPQLAEAHSTNGVVLNAMGRVDAAIAESDSAGAVDPLSGIVGFQRMLILYAAHRYRDAIAQHRRMAELDSTFFYLEAFDGMSYLQLGLPDSALIAFEHAKPSANGQPMAGLAMTYARLGRRAEARQVALALEEWYRHHYYPPDYIAAAWASLGDLDRAFIWLNRVFEVRSSFWALLPGAPEFAPLRHDPRWAAFEKRAGVK
ncbi:MAG: protein kinase [Gemmatimonadales bacterium]